MFSVITCTMTELEYCNSFPVKGFCKTCKNDIHLKVYLCVKNVALIVDTLKKPNF